MLESSVWRQYNSENNFRQKLSEFTHIDVLDLISDDKALYGVLKAKLTKKELKLFAMDSAKMSNEEMCAAFSLNEEELVQAKFKLYKKLKQDKTKISLRESNAFSSEDYE